MNALRAPFSLVVLFCGLGGSLSAQPNVTATLDDGVTSSARKQPGQNIDYTVVISNGGSAAATNVQLTAPAPANTVDVGTVNVTPVAINDAYPQSVIANTSVNTALASNFSVIANDYGGISAGTAVAVTSLTVTAFDATTTGGGSVSMTTTGANVGKFTYTPAPGFTGTDTFTYTISSGVAGGAASNRVATVSITVAGPVIWYVNPNLGTNGNGTLASPFNNLAAAVAAIGTNNNHRIFLYSGGAAQTTGLALRSGGWVVGQAVVGADFATVMGVTFGSDSINAPPAINNASKPSLTRSGATTLTLGENSKVLGLAVANTAGGFAIASAGVDAAQVGSSPTSDVTIAASGTASGAVSIGAGAGTIAINAPITSSAGKSVTVTGRTGNSVSFTGGIVDTGTGISLTSNTGATIAFTGGLNVSSGASVAFSATGGGTVSATQNNSSIVNLLATTTSTALNVVNTGIGAAGLTFRSINAGTAASGPANAVVLNSTGAAGGLTVTGTGAANSGGLIRNTTGDAIALSGAQQISLTDLQVQTAGGSWVNATDVTDLTLTRFNADLSTSHGLRGSNLRNLTIAGGTFDRGGAGNASAQFHGVYLTNLLGSSSVTGATFRRSNTIQFRVENTTATAFTGTPDQLLVSGTNWNTHNNAFAGDHLSVDANTGGNFQLTVNASAGINTVNEGGTVATGGGSGVQATCGGTNGKMTVSVTGLKTSNNTAGVALGNSGGGHLEYNVFGNKTANGTGFSSTGTVAIILTHASAGGTSHGVINDNSIVHTAGPGTNALQVIIEGSAVSNTGGTGTTTISNNVISGNYQRGIQAQARIATATLNATINNNQLTETDTTGAALQQVNVETGGSGGGHANTVRLNMFSNTVNLGSGASHTAAYRVICRTGCVFQLQNFAGSGSNTADVATWVTSTKSNSGTPVSVTASAAFSASVGNIPTLLLAPAAPSADDRPGQSGGRVSAGALREWPTQASSTAPAPRSPAAPSAPAAEVKAQGALPAPPPMPTATTVSEEHLTRLVQAARARWEATGLTAEQSAVLRALTFELADLPALHLGDADGRSIRLSRRAAGTAWFVDPTPETDEAFPYLSGGRRLARPTDGAAGGVDLLTTILHEMGHALGLADTYDLGERHDVMFGQLSPGERRLPRSRQAAAAPLPPAFSGLRRPLAAAVTVPSLPAGKSVVVTYSVQISAGVAPTVPSISSQGSVSGSNFATVQTDDPELAGSQATVTLLGIPPVFTSAASTVFVVGTLGSFPVTAAGQPAPTFSTASALPGGVTLAANGTLSGTAAANSGGTYPLTIVASNGFAPNASQSFVLTVRQAPAITSAGSATFTVGTPGSFTVTTTGFPTPTLAQGGASLPSGLTFVDNGNGTGTLAGTPAAATGGSYALTFTATNVVNSTAPQSFVLTVRQAPAITSAAAATFTAGAAGSFTVAATGFPAPALARGGAALPAGVTFVDNGDGTGTLAGTPSAGTGGTYALTFTATNAAGATAPQSFTLTVQQAPVITSAAGATFTTGTLGSFTVAATGFPAPALVRGGVALPAGVTFVDNGDGTGTLAGTPSAGTGGTYALTFTATNVVGATTPQSFTLTVQQAPAITSGNATTFTIGQNGSFAVSASGFPTPTLTRGGDALPAGVTYVDQGNGSGSLAGTPANGTAGVYHLTFTATSAAGSTGPVAFTLTVDAGTVAPTINSANSTVFNLGVPGSFTVTTTGMPAPASITAGGALPNGVTFTNNGDGTATLAGTPASGTGGSYPLTLTASNGTPPDAIQAFTLVVNRPPVAGTDTLGTKRNVTAQMLVAKMLRNDTDPDGDPVSLVSVSPASAQGGAVSVASGVVTYVPPTGYLGADSFAYTIADGRGAQASGTVNVLISTEAAPSLNIVSLTVDGSGALIVCQGVPGLTYRIQSTDSLAQPFTDQSGVLTADAAGRFQFQDPRLPGQQPPTRFYRAVYSP